MAGASLSNSAHVDTTIIVLARRGYRTSHVLGVRDRRPPNDLSFLIGTQIRLISDLSGAGCLTSRARFAVLGPTPADPRFA
jgi:hypothetical protein